MTKTVALELRGKELNLETGKMARQADGSVVARYGDTVVLATAVSSKTAREGIDFFPLTIDYIEKADQRRRKS
jgi:polyribonucleotide nucleotidyltransferase